jgi:hypothetical protein
VEGVLLHESNACSLSPRHISKVIDVAKVIHGIGRTKAEATIIAIEDHVIWFAPKHGGRLKAPLRMLPDAEVNMRIRFTQCGDIVQRVEKL